MGLGGRGSIGLYDLRPFNPGELYSRLAGTNISRVNGRSSGAPKQKVLRTSSYGILKEGGSKLGQVPEDSP